MFKNHDLEKVNDLLTLLSLKYPTKSIKYQQAF